jgi:hypothetical protein
MIGRNLHRKIGPSPFEAPPAEKAGIAPQGDGYESLLAASPAAVMLAFKKKTASRITREAVVA